MRTTRRELVREWTRENGLEPSRVVSIKITAQMTLEVEEWVPHPITGKKFHVDGRMATATRQRAMKVPPTW